MSLHPPGPASSFTAEPFVPRPRLRGGHLQTLASNFLPRENRLPPGEERLFNVEQDVQVMCHCHWQPDRQKALTVVIVHGLEGSIASQYMIGTGSKAWDAGMNVVRMNMRNCGGTERLGPTLYHSGLSGDVSAVIRTLIEQDKLPRVAAVGYSMGGNLVLKMAGEWGDAPPPQVCAVAGVSPAMDLSLSADALNERRNRLYELNFLWNLNRRLRHKARLFPDRYTVKRLGPFRSIRHWDNEVTARYGGFRDAEDYYTRSSSSRVADRITVPALVIHSLDDPFIRMTDATRAKLAGNPHITFLETAHGGHCAFLAPANGYDGRWAERTVIQFLRQQMAR